MSGETDVGDLLDCVYDAALAPELWPSIVARLTEAGVGFAEISAHRATLEEAYMELTRDAVEFRATPASTEEAAR